MRRALVGLAVLVAAFGSVASGQSDGGVFTGGLDPTGPISLQVQLCKLNPGQTMGDYEAMLNDYFEWSRSNGAEATFARLTPMWTHGMPGEQPYDFVELLALDHETTGTAWDKWLFTEDGARLNATWQNVATCSVKMTTAYTQWADVEAMNEDDERIATWNWCTRKPGVSLEQLVAKHRSIAANRVDAWGNIGWFVIVPQIGRGGAPGRFAHVWVYPNVAGLMSSQKWLDEGGASVRGDYTTSYATCTGEEAFIEEILNRPGD
ncbi:MAG: hypothetical protein VYE73_13590 [Acidobacteriota bacterium]|nr:hypothetical protein [Acidobacteriota bacterium]